MKPKVCARCGVPLVRKVYGRGTPYRYLESNAQFSRRKYCGYSCSNASNPKRGKEGAK